MSWPRACYVLAEGMLCPGRGHAMSWPRACYVLVIEHTPEPGRAVAARGLTGPWPYRCNLQQRRLEPASRETESQDVIGGARGLTGPGPSHPVPHSRSRVQFWCHVPLVVSASNPLFHVSYTGDIGDTPPLFYPLF
jgi:hypothetical protein